MVTDQRELYESDPIAYLLQAPGGIEWAINAISGYYFRFAINDPKNVQGWKMENENTEIVFNKWFLDNDERIACAKIDKVAMTFTFWVMPDLTVEQRYGLEDLQWQINRYLREMGWIMAMHQYVIDPPG